MSNQKHNLQNLESIIVDNSGDKPVYFLRYEWEESNTVGIAHPLYTGNMAANGNLIVSKTLKSIQPHTRTGSGNEVVETNKEIASELVSLGKEKGLIDGDSYEVIPGSGETTATVIIRLGS